MHKKGTSFTHKFWKIWNKKIVITTLMNDSVKNHKQQEIEKKHSSVVLVSSATATATFTSSTDLRPSHNFV